MSKYVDFAAIKDRHTIVEIAELLGLSLKKEGQAFRCSCPACDAGNDRAIAINPATDKFYCHLAKEGGDLIALVAHIQNLGMRDAAEYIDCSLTVPTESELAQPPNTPTDQHPFSKIAASLQYDHPVLSELGLTAEEAAALAIGYKKAGVLRGMIVLPLRDSSGRVVRCLGLPLNQVDQCALGKPFNALPDANVVAFPKKTA